MQDTGPDGAGGRWAARRLAPDQDELFTAWTIRGAPHVYRRAQAAAVAAAVAPVSGGRCGQAGLRRARPLKEAGIPVLEQLDRIAEEMRSIVPAPTVKGDLSGERCMLACRSRTERFCRVCDAVHVYEQPFRFSALRGGLESTPGTSPPLRGGFPAGRVFGHGRSRPAPGPGCAAPIGPLTPKQVASYLDAPVKDVRARWPDDVETVDVEGEELKKAAGIATTPGLQVDGGRRAEVDRRPTTATSTAGRDHR